MQLSGVPLELQEISLLHSLSGIYVSKRSHYEKDENKNVVQPFMTELSVEKARQRYAEQRRSQIKAHNDKMQVGNE